MAAEFFILKNYIETNESYGLNLLQRLIDDLILAKITQFSQKLEYDF